MTRRAMPAPGRTRFDSASFAPIAVAIRNDFEESLHYGAGVVLDDLGVVAHKIGDIDTVVYPRSCLKPLQADAMIAAGLTAADDHLAIACASHSGEPQHLQTVESLLSVAGVDESSLANTPARPYGAAARAALRADGIGPSSLQQNCSGKHAAMLATCQVNGWPIDGYLEERHPLQQQITAHIEALAGERIGQVGVDGCGAPTHTLSLLGLATAFAALTRDGHAPQVAEAMGHHPELVGGAGRDVTMWMRAVPGLIAKDGAAGVMAAALPDGRAVAYKIADGSDDARRAVMPEAMRLLGIDPEVIDRVAEETAVAVLGGGESVGRLVGLEWPGRG